MSTLDPIPSGAGPRTTWLVAHQATTVVDEPFTGWLTVYADADDRTVSFGDPPNDDNRLEPAEARALARALVLAADHAEDHHSVVMQTVTAIRDELSDAMGAVPDEAKRAAHAALQAMSSGAYRRRDAASEQAKARAALSPRSSS